MAGKKLQKPPIHEETRNFQEARKPPRFLAPETTDSSGSHESSKMPKAIWRPPALLISFSWTPHKVGRFGGVLAVVR
jgi:hypothetical protein